MERRSEGEEGMEVEAIERKGSGEEGMVMGRSQSEGEKVRKEGGVAAVVDELTETGVVEVSTKIVAAGVVETDVNDGRTMVDDERGDGERIVDDVRTEDDDDERMTENGVHGGVRVTDGERQAGMRVPNGEALTADGVVWTTDRDRRVAVGAVADRGVAAGKQVTDKVEGDRRSKSVASNDITGRR